MLEKGPKKFGNRRHRLCYHIRQVTALVSKLLMGAVFGTSILGKWRS